MNCSYCERPILNKGSLRAHEMVCKSNPNRKKHYRSPKSGAQPGSTPWNKGLPNPRKGCWKYSFEEVFIENSPQDRSLIRKRVINDKLLEYKCACCGMEPVWQGKPLPLVLDHINGVNNDNRLENLRFVCSNCDSQLPTYKSKNRTRKN